MVAPLRLVRPEPHSPQDSYSFRADVRPSLWGAGVFALLAAAAAAVGFAGRAQPLFCAVIAALFLVSALWLFAGGVSQHAVRYSLGSARLEVERGLFGRRLESIELWRVRDVVLDQTFFERVRGVGRITLHSTDRVEPVLTVGPVAGARALFERLRDAVAAARQNAGVVRVDD